MNELLRLHYLDAMGISQYVARMPLPGACPSLSIPLEIPQENLTAPVTLLQKNLVPEKPAFQKPAYEKPAAMPATDIFQCQLAIWSVEDLLVIAEAPRLENSHLSLLRNILQAIGRKSDLPAVQQFVWPLPQRKDRSLQAARDHFQGLLDGGLLKQKIDQKIPVRQILLFGKTTAALLQESPDVIQSGTLDYHSWPVLIVHSLHEMLQQPECKRDVWKALQVLLRA